MLNSSPGTTVMDHDDPLLEPIHGVSFELYTRLSTDLLRRGVTGTDAVEQAVADHGVDAGRWREIQLGWVQRMGDSLELRERFGHATEHHRDDTSPEEPA